MRQIKQEHTHTHTHTCACSACKHPLSHPALKFFMSTSTTTLEAAGWFSTDGYPIKAAKHSQRWELGEVFVCIMLQNRGRAGYSKRRESAGMTGKSLTRPKRKAVSFTLLRPVLHVARD